MYRDFSENSKKKILALVSEVENEKWCDFTDWVGDRWLDFQSWIGKLNIKRYINNVNAYHKKVIDKNNATKKSIEKIFRNVATVDSSYKKTFSSIKNELSQWQKYINDMSQIVNPKNGKYDSKYISSTLDKRLKTISDIEVDNKKAKSKEELTREILGNESEFLKALSKLTKNKDKGKSNDLALTSSVMSYITGLYTFYTADYNDASDIIAGGLKLTNNSTKMWDGTYKYLEKNLSTLDASRFGKRFQTKVSMASLVGNICGFASDSIGAYKTLIDEDAEGYEKIGSVLKTSSSGANVVQAGINVKFGQKTLTRDIHAKYQWGLSAKNAKIVDNANTAVSLIGVIADTGQGAINQYGKVSADGIVDSNDHATIGIHGSVRGLTSIAGKLSFGVTDILGLPEKSEEISNNIIDFADEKGGNFVRTHDFSSQYVQNAQFLMDYADNQDNNIILRIGAESVAGAGMIGAVVIDGVGDGCKWIGNKISDGWKTVSNWF